MILMFQAHIYIPDEGRGDRNIIGRGANLQNDECGASTDRVEAKNRYRYRSHVWNPGPSSTFRVNISCIFVLARINYVRRVSGSQG